MAVNRNLGKGWAVRVHSSQPVPAEAPRSEAEEFDATAASVRPTKVAKARKLIARPAYPTKPVVRSLARQIARFF